MEYVINYYSTRIMQIEKYDFNYNISVKTYNCINAIDFTYHISNLDYPVVHYHTDYFEFTILTKGIIETITKGKKRIIEAGNLFVTLSNVEHSFINKGDELYFINIICRNKVLKEINDFYGCDLEELFASRVNFKLPDDLIYRLKASIDFVNSLNEDEWEKCNSILRSTVIELINYIYLDSLKINYNAEKWEIALNNLKQNGDF